MDIEKIKEHFKKHKEAYLVGAVSLVLAGFTGVIVRERHASLLKGLDGPAGATVRPLNFLSKTGDIVTTIHNGSRGNPGFRIHNFDYDLDFDTQGAGARAFGIPENVMSMHLNGKIPNANGWHFERIAS